MAGMLGTGAGVAALLLLLRVMAVAHWDWTVAGHILDAFDFGGAIGVAVGTLFASPVIAGIVVSLVTPVAVMAAIIAIRHKRFMSGALAVAILGTAMLLSLTFTAGTWWALIIAAVLTAAIILVMNLHHLGKLHNGVAWIVRRLGITVTLGLVALALLVQDPWASAELITTTDGTVRELFVLKESPSGMHVLVPGGDVEILMNSDVVRRTYP